MSINTLENAVETLIDDLLRVNPNEDLLIITDYMSNDIGLKMLTNTCMKRNLKNHVICIPKLNRNGEEPPGEVLRYWEPNNPVIAYTSLSQSSTNFRRYVCNNGGRFYSIPGGAPSLLLLSFDKKDMETMSKRGKIIKKNLDKSSEVNIECSTGNLRIPLDGRLARIDLGICQNSGDFASPGLEVNIVPQEYSANGMISAIAIVPSLNIFEEEVNLEVEGGVLTGKFYCSTTKDYQIMNLFMANIENSMLRIAELGFGLNHRIKFPADSYIANESVWRTIHIGIGRNLTLGGTFDAPGHLDIVIQPKKTYIGSFNFEDIA